MLVTLDVAAGILFVIIGIGLSIGVVSTVAQFPALVAECGSTITGGVPCESAGLVDTVVLAVVIVAVFAAALGLGFFVVRLIQKRLAFYWPIIGIVVTTAALYAGTAVIGSVAS